MNKIFYPPSIDWELTSLCNHNCIHCYNYWRQSDKVEITKYKKYFLDVAWKIVESKPVSVQITGGEPLLVWDMVKDAIEVLLSNSINVSINTNATLVTEEIANFFGKNQMDAFVSFPCCKAEIFDEIVNQKGAFEKAILGIKKLIDGGVRVSLNMVVTKRNLRYVYDTAKYVKDNFHVTYFSATKASFPQNAHSTFRKQMISREEFNYMLKELLRVKSDLGMRVDSAWVYSLCGFDDEVMEQFGFKRKCTCGKYSFVLDSKGEIKACGCDDCSYGNILETSFSTAIERMTKWQNGELLPQLCRSCIWLKYCGGGCRADALSMHKKSCAMDSTANPDKTRVELKYFSKMDENILEKAFILNPYSAMVIDNNMIRVSYRTNYHYVTLKFAEYMKSHKGFSVDDLERASGQNKFVSSYVLEQLFRKKIILESEHRVNNIGDYEGFDLVISPYVDEATCNWQSDYAGVEYNCVRYS